VTRYRKTNLLRPYHTTHGFDASYLTAVPQYAGNFTILKNIDSALICRPGIAPSDRIMPGTTGPQLG
jgi:hypothetical protein